MAYVPVPKDLTKVKTKVLFGLTKRQLICFSLAALVGLPVFVLLRKSSGNSTAAMCMILVMLPFGMLALYEKNGRPLEKVIHDMIQVLFVRPKQRPYQTNNYYAVLQRQSRLNEEVQQIVRGAKHKAAPSDRAARKAPSGGKNNSETNPRGKKTD